MALLVPNTQSTPGSFPDDQLSDEDASSVYFDASSRPSSPSLSNPLSHNYTIGDLVHELQESSKGWLEIMELYAPQEKAPSQDARTSFYASQVTEFLGHVIDDLIDEDYEDAAYLARMALNAARRANNEILIARSYYWLGRCYLEMRNYTKAYKYFERARPCARDKHCQEAFDLEFLLRMTRSRISAEEQTHEWNKRVDALLADVKKNGSATMRFETISSKRKRDSQTWELVLRPVPRDTSSPRPRRTTSRQTKGKTQRTNTTAKQQPWMVHESEDLPDYHGSSADRGNGNKEGLKWVQQTHPPLKGRPFTKRCCLVRLSPRIRPMNIFSEHPCETILTAEEWELLRVSMSGYGITMSWLEREMKINEAMKQGKIKRAPARELKLEIARRRSEKAAAKATRE